MSNSRIDELRLKFDENPRRYFAPLANEYRKSGDLTTAIALCREHLPKQPGHMSGHIVFGQALYEANALVESRQVFEAALTLDPENLIALRHLVDIARADGDSRLARRWYERMLDVDPHNDEIAHQLSALATPPIPAAAIPYQPVVEVPPPSVDGSSTEPTPSVPFDATLFAPVATPDASHQAIGAPVDQDVRLNPGQADEQTVMGEADEGDDAHVVSHQQASDDAQAIDDAFAGMDDDEDAVVEGYASTQVDEDSVDGTTTVDIESIAFADPINIGEALDAFDAHDPGIELDPAIGGTPAAPADVDALPSLSTHDYSAAFEEGLIAPEWPDTSALVARVEHPPAIAPVTPAFSQEAVSAFGRESVDPEREPVVDDIEYGERDFAASERAGSDTADAIDVSDHTATSWADTRADVVASDQAVGAAAVGESEQPVAAADDGATEHHAAAAAHADDADDADDAADAADADHVVVSEQAADADDVVLRDESADPTDAQGSSVESFDDSDQSDVAIEDADELPWLVASDAPSEVQEVARAMSRDARASGETEAIRLEVHEGADAEDESPPEHVHAQPDAPAFVTETMAELLISQGFVERAATVYEELVRRRPYDPVLSTRLDELRERLAAPAMKPPETGASEEVAEATPTPDRQSFQASMPTPIIAPRASSYEDELPRVTARQRFAKLAVRRVPRRTPPRAAVAVETPADGLAGLFGAANEHTSDEYAARAFADAFAPMDEPPFGASNTPVFVTRTVTAPSMPTVASTPTPGAAPAPSATPPTSSGFSFDRFFPDPATVSPTPPASPATGHISPSGTTPAQSPPVSDDLAEFAAWLKGLDKP